MRTSAHNPKMETIRQQVHSSFNQLNQLVQGPLASMETAKLYQEPVPGEWTIMENLAHVNEMMPYWADEAAKLVAAPGNNFGRTMEDERRLAAISEHRMDSLEQVRAMLSVGYAYLDRVLSSLNDSDLELTGKHKKFGEQNLEWFINDFIIHHLADHVQQIENDIVIFTRKEVL